MAKPETPPVATHARRPWWTIGLGILAAAGTVVCVILLAGNLMSTEVAPRDNRVHSLPRDDTAEQLLVKSVTDTTQSRVLDRVKPAIGRTNRLARDPAILAALANCNRESTELVANTKIAGSAEFDVLALFNNGGTLCGFNTASADGTPLSREGIETLYEKSFGGRAIIGSCLNATRGTRALEFQFKCDFTPALHGSDGLSVAYTVPVFNPTSGQQLGLISCRLWFDRILEVLPPPGSVIGAVFVGDSGEVFRERGQPSPKAFAIPPKVVKEMISQLDDSGDAQDLFIYNGLAVDLTKVPHGSTIEGGSLYVLTFANTDWVTIQTRQSRTTNALAGASVSVAALCGLALMWGLQRRRLAEIAETAESASDAKSNFLAAMSHEIRTPMNGVVGMIDVLMQTSLRARQMEMAKSIRSSANALLGVVGQILDFSKIEAGKLSLDPGPMSLEDVIDGAADLVSPLMAKRSIEFSRFTDPAIPALVVGDPDRIRQIIVNLLSNALKFAGGLDRTARVELRARLVAQEAEKITVEISVNDNGMGMSEGIVRQLFQPFQQGETGSLRSHGGTGLGLAISQRLANLMGGAITVRSASGVGSMFLVRLPLAAQPLQPSPAPVVSGTRVAVVGRTIQRIHDLVAYLHSADIAVARAEDIRAAEVTDATIWVVTPGDGLSIEQIREAVRSRSARHRKSGPVLVVTTAPATTLPYHDGEVRQLDGGSLTRRSLLSELAVAMKRATATSDQASPSPEVRLRDTLFVSRVRHANHRILVAEDNETNQHVIRLQLDLLGFPTDLVADGLGALEAWRSGSYSLILTDLHMPKMDGLQFVEALRAEEAQFRKARIPIFALTANATEGTDAICRSVGFDEYLTKPVLLPDLAELLERWLPPMPTPRPHVAPDRTEPKPEGSPPVHVDMLKGVVGDNPMLMAQLIGEYLDHSAVHMARMAIAIGAGDVVAAGHIAHNLKSASRTVGALEMARFSAVFERAGIENDLASATTALPLLQEEWTRAKEFLDAWLAQGADSADAPGTDCESDGAPDQAPRSA